MKVNFIGFILLFCANTMNVNTLQVSSQEPDFCHDEIEAPSSSMRTVSLIDFGIKVDIPDNYRAIKKQDGSIEFVTAKEYRIIQAIQQGRCFSLEYYPMSIESLDIHDSSISQRKLIEEYSEGKKIIGTYRNEVLFGYILLSREEGMIDCAMSFIGKFKGKQQLVKVVAGDGNCPPQMQQMTNFLQTFKALSVLE